VPHKDHNKNSFGHLVYVEIDGDQGNQLQEDQKRLTPVFIEKEDVQQIIAQDSLMQHFWKSFLDREKDPTAL
jgi:hypothetical protein